MVGLYNVFRKELADGLSSLRFILLLAITLVASILILREVGGTIRSSVSPESPFVFLKLFTIPASENFPLTDFQSFMAAFIPLISILLVFDAVNSERNAGTMSRLLSQPIYRDAVINGKFLAAIAIIAIMMTSLVLLISGAGMRMIGVWPTSEEIVRLFFFLVIAIVYGAFWIGLGILFSVLFRQVGISALASIGVWLFLFIFINVIAQVIAGNVAPVTENSPAADIIRNNEISLNIQRLSPMNLFLEAMVNLLVPERNMIMRFLSSREFAVPTPLSFGQSLLTVWPQLVVIVLLTVICFAISYVKFMKEEIRSL